MIRDWKLLHRRRRRRKIGADAVAGVNLHQAPRPRKPSITLKERIEELVAIPYKLFPTLACSLTAIGVERNHIIGCHARGASKLSTCLVSLPIRVIRVFDF